MYPYVIVDGTDICSKWDLFWTNDSVLGPPEVRTNLVEVPGMDGALDLTETLTGDAVYGPRAHEFVFLVLGERDFEQAKTELCNLLHGKAHEYELSVDPGYTYSGRWVCDSYHSRLHHREIKFTVSADPWKRGGHRTYIVKGAGGKVQRLENGRRHVIPVITVQTPTLIEYQDRTWEVGADEPGSYLIDDLRLAEGESDIYVNSAPSYCDTTWADLIDIYGDPLEPISEKRWAELFVHKTDPPEGAEYDVVIDYDTYDL